MFFSLSLYRWKDSASVVESHAVRPADEARVRILRKKDTYGHVRTPCFSGFPLSPSVYTYLRMQDMQRCISASVAIIYGYVSSYGWTTDIHTHAWREVS